MADEYGALYCVYETRRRPKSLHGVPEIIVPNLVVGFLLVKGNDHAVYFLSLSKVYHELREAHLVVDTSPTDKACMVLMNNMPNVTR
jgi:hypothetical protein